jgi:glutamine synthetase
MIKDHDVKLVDFKFTDLPGSWQHFTTTLTEYNEEIFTEGLGFDGSSIRGWRAINASDMLVIPDPTTAWIDVFNAEPTLSLICTIVDPITREPYDRDPRGVAEKAEAYLQSTGIADTAFFGPEAEFFIFDEVRYSYSGQLSFHLVDSAEGHWNSGKEEFPNLGYKIRAKEGYFPLARWTRCRTSATRCAWSWRKPVFRSSGSITKSRPQARPRSMLVSRR